MAKGEALRDRTAAAIVDSAAAIMAEHGGAASMNEIASAAGVSRATLYRYFPSREALLRSMAANSVEELGQRIADADLHGIPVEQAVARLARGFIAVGSKYAALTGFQRTGDHPDADTLLAEPVRALFRRGVADGSMRADLAPEVLTDLFSGLIKAALEMTAGGRMGTEEAAAAVVAVFLDGARARRVS
jgi:TetR/AcrR family transcriptional regulator, mexCD-oprJ operon repressor